MSTPTPHHFAVEASLLGGTVHIDGQPIEGVTAWQVTSGNAQRPTTLAVWMAGDGTITGEGIVEVVRDGITGDAVRRLNPEAIRAAVTDRLSMGSSSATAYRDVIADLLDQAGQT